MKIVLNIVLLFVATITSFAQNNTSYWQQKVSYKMDIDFDIEKHQYQGNQELIYPLQKQGI